MGICRPPGARKLSTRARSRVRSTQDPGGRNHSPNSGYLHPTSGTLLYKQSQTLQRAHHDKMVGNSGKTDAGHLVLSQHATERRASSERGPQRRSPTITTRPSPRKCTRLTAGVAHETARGAHGTQTPPWPNPTQPPGLAVVRCGMKRAAVQQLFPVGALLLAVFTNLLIAAAQGPTSTYGDARVALGHNTAPFCCPSRVTDWSLELMWLVRWSNALGQARTCPSISQRRS